MIPSLQPHNINQPQPPGPLNPTPQFRTSPIQHYEILLPADLHHAQVLEPPRLLDHVNESVQPAIRQSFPPVVLP